MTTTLDLEHQGNELPDGLETTDAYLGAFVWDSRTHQLYARNPRLLALVSATANGCRVLSAMFEVTSRGMVPAWLADSGTLGIVINERLLRSGLTVRAAALAAYHYTGQPWNAKYNITPATTRQPRIQAPKRQGAQA